VQVKADYSKWLGPGWIPRYDRYGIQVSNHVCYLDIFVQFVLDSLVCGFVQRNGVKKVMCIGFISEVIGGVFIKRASTKEERAKGLETIKVR
jgi:lysophosphatidylcholine acyltransferase / lyso-PAF acetyltransferase